MVTRLHDCKRVLSSNQALNKPFYMGNTGHIEFRKSIYCFGLLLIGYNKYWVCTPNTQLTNKNDQLKAFVNRFLFVNRAFVKTFVNHIQIG